KGFRDFILRGNVLELAVAFVMGAAFTAVVNQLVASFLNPLIRVILGGKEASGSFTVRGQVFDYGTFVNVVIAVLLTALAVYFFVVLPVNKIAERRARGRQPEPEEMSDEVRLLTDIRDELRAERR
ncbi:MAG TPA: large conductance mechanosensitive channel protein MscL, partial [Rugosimonospora sp.]|nr:large conductance mechanosensitive channel protein MscL [Rugosimonospora sp.]